MNRAQVLGRGPRIGLLGMYSSRNLGDTALVREIIKGIQARIPGAQFIALNLDPEDTARTHGIPAFPASGYGPAVHADGTPWLELEHPGAKWLVRGLGTRRILAAAQTIDLLVMAGGGQIEDFFGGAVSQPRILLTWTALARLRRIPVAYFSVGVDQIFGRASRAMAVVATELAQFRSFREAESIEILRKSGLRKACRVDPDPALGLDASAIVRSEFRDRDLIVVSPISFRTWTLNREPSYDGYLRCLAAACERWIQERKRIRFICSETSMDPPVVHEVLASLNSTARQSCEFVKAGTVEDFVSNAGQGALTVASRLHGLILSVAAGTPVIAISPARKVTRFMCDCGFSDVCIDMRSIELESLLRLSRGVDQQGDRFARAAAEIAATSRARLSTAYDDLAAFALSAWRSREPR